MGSPVPQKSASKKQSLRAKKPSLKTKKTLKPRKSNRTLKPRKSVPKVKKTVSKVKNAAPRPAPNAPWPSMARETTITSENSYSTRKSPYTKQNSVASFESCTDSTVWIRRLQAGSPRSRSMTALTNISEDTVTTKEVAAQIRHELGELHETLSKQDAFLQTKDRELQKAREVLKKAGLYDDFLDSLADDVTPQQRPSQAL